MVRVGKERRNLCKCRLQQHERRYAAKEVFAGSVEAAVVVGHERAENCGTVEQHTSCYLQGYSQTT